MSWCKCPSCGEGTGWKQDNGQTRCIPCGHGLVKGPTATPEQSRKAAEFLSGGKWR